MHGVAPHMCDQVVRPLLDQGAGGRSPGFPLLTMRVRRCRSVAAVILPAIAAAPAIATASVVAATAGVAAIATAPAGGALATAATVIAVAGISRGIRRPLGPIALIGPI